MITLFSHQPAKKILPVIAALLLAALCVMGARAAAAKTLAEVEIPAGPLNQTLLAISAAFNVDILAPDELVAGRRALALSGRLSAAEALDRALQDSGLEARPEDGAYLIATSAEEAEEPELLPRLGVEGEAPAARFRRPDLPEAYEGGQVAFGSRIGLLGNRDIFDIPFSVTSYTAELIDNQQAKTVADVIHNDPSARLLSAGQSAQETIAIRGFSTGGSGAELYDGLPGLADRRRSTVRTLERVEVFKGASALLTGTIGAVGGVINLVPKRPAKTSMTKLTTDYNYKSRFGIHADLSRRFGSKGQFGARLNTAYRKGESAIEDNDAELGEVALALEYRGDKLKLETILHYDERDLDRGNHLFIAQRSATSIPSAPDLEDSIQQPWEKSETEFARAFLKMEYDISKDWTLHAAYGAIDFKDYTLRTIGTNLDTNGNFNALAQQYSETQESYTWVAGIRGQFETGEITHQFSLETMQTEAERGQAFENIPNSRFTSNLFNPVFITRPVFNRVARSNPPKILDNTESSIAIANTVGFLDERILLTAGIRRQNIENKNFNANTGILTRKYDKSANTPAIGLVVKPWSFMSVYGNYIEALERGLIARPNTANSGEVFPPSETEQIEFGVKFDMDGFGLTAGLFQMERPLGITDANNRFSVDGEQRHRGLELNAFGQLRPDFRLLGGITYIDSELTRTQGGKFDGNKSSGVPKLAAVLNLEWDAPVLAGLTLMARAEHNGKQYVRSDNTVDIPSYELYGIGARYKRTMGDQQFILRMNIDNLLNEEYWATFTGIDNFLYLGAPRRFVMSFSMDF